MKGKIEAIKMLIGMLKRKNTGIFICKGKKETLIFSCGNDQNMTNMLGNAIDEDQTVGRFLILGVLATIFSNGKVPYLNDEGRRKLIKILSEDTMKQDKQ